MLMADISWPLAVTIVVDGNNTCRCKATAITYVPHRSMIKACVFSVEIQFSFCLINGSLCLKEEFRGLE